MPIKTQRSSRSRRQRSKPVNSRNGSAIPVVDERTIPPGRPIVEPWVYIECLVEASEWILANISTGVIDAPDFTSNWSEEGGIVTLIKIRIRVQGSQARAALNFPYSYELYDVQPGSVVPP